MGCEKCGGFGMAGVPGIAEGQQRITIEQKLHGKSASMARTCAEVIGFAPGRALTTAKPETGSIFMKEGSLGFDAARRAEGLRAVFLVLVSMLMPSDCETGAGVGKNASATQ